MSKSPAKQSEDANGFVPDADAWSKFERATAQVVKAAEREKAKRKPARIVKKSKPTKAR